MVDHRNLCKLAYVNGFNVWSYRAHYHTRKEVQVPNYFNAVLELKPSGPQTGDKIEVSATDGGCSLFVEILDFQNTSVVRVIPWG